jgi:hypothetical protein
MKNYPLRFTADKEHLKKALEKVAKMNDRSFNAEVLRAIDFYLKNAPDAQHEVETETKEVKKKPSGK